MWLHPEKGETTFSDWAFSLVKLTVYPSACLLFTPEPDALSNSMCLQFLSQKMQRLQGVDAVWPGSPLIPDARQPPVSVCRLFQGCSSIWWLRRANSRWHSLIASVVLTAKFSTLYVAMMLFRRTVWPMSRVHLLLTTDTTGLIVFSSGHRWVLVIVLRVANWKSAACWTKLWQRKGVKIWSCYTESELDRKTRISEH